MPNITTAGFTVTTGTINIEDMFVPDQLKTRKRVLLESGRMTRKTDPPPPNTGKCFACHYDIPLSSLVKVAGYADPVKAEIRKLYQPQFCSGCYERYATCTRCGLIVPAEEFLAGAVAAVVCPECGTGHKPKLRMEPEVEFKPRSNILMNRREKVWPTISRSAQTPSASQ